MAKTAVGVEAATWAEGLAAAMPLPPRLAVGVADAHDFGRDSDLRFAPLLRLLLAPPRTHCCIVHFAVDQAARGDGHSPRSRRRRRWPPPASPKPPESRLRPAGVSKQGRRRFLVGEEDGGPQKAFFCHCHCGRHRCFPLPLVGLISSRASFPSPPVRPPAQYPDISLLFLLLPRCRCRCRCRHRLPLLRLLPVGVVPPASPSSFLLLRARIALHQMIRPSSHHCCRALLLGDLPRARVRGDGERMNRRTSGEGREATGAPLTWQ